MDFYYIKTYKELDLNRVTYANVNMKSVQHKGNTDSIAFAAHGSKATIS